MQRAVLHFFILMLCAPIPIARAQDFNAVLRAGEHKDFTRLVLSLPDAVSWRLEESTTYLDLIIENDTIAFDLSQTFDRIPRTRLRAVEETPSGLRFYLGCQCTVRRVDGIAGQVVFDIVTKAGKRDETPPLTVPGTSPRPRPRPDPAERVVPFVEEISVARRAGARLAHTLRGEHLSGGSDPLILQTVPLPDADVHQKRAPQDANGRLSAFAAQSLTESLTTAISGAVSRNLLSARDEFSKQPEKVTPILPESADKHVSMQTGRTRTQSTIDETPCTEAVTNHIQDWSSPAKNGLQEQDWSALYDPLDRIDPQVALTLGTNMLRIGFGAEARALFSLAPATPAIDSLRAVSFLLDQEAVPDPGALLRFAHCSDLDTLWAFLAAPTHGSAIANRPERIVRAIQALPRAMRVQIGPRVVQHLLRNNDPDIAGLVQASIARAGTDGGTDTVSAHPDLLRGFPEQIATLGPNAASRLTDAELLLLLENAEAREKTVPLELLTQAASRQFAHRRSDMGRALAQAVARGLARASEFETAFELATNHESDLPEAAVRRLLSDLYLRLVEDADDTGFVTTIFDHMPKADDSLPFEILDKLSDRLDALGFVSEASALRPTQGPSLANPNLAAPTALPAPGSREFGTKSVEPPQVPDASARSPRRDASQPEQGRTVQTESATEAGNSSVAQEIQSTSPDSVERPAARPNTRVGASFTASDQNSRDPSTDPLEAGLLAQGRSRLRDAEALRSQISTLLDDTQ